MRRGAAGWRFPSLRGVGWDKKGGSVATSRGMNAKQGDYKCRDRINTLPNTHGCYDGLWRKSVLILHRAWPARRNHINENSVGIKRIVLNSPLYERFQTQQMFLFLVGLRSLGEDFMDTHHNRTLIL